jgi:hypothetical protein
VRAAPRAPAPVRASAEVLADLRWAAGFTDGALPAQAVPAPSWLAAYRYQGLSS